MAYGRVMSKPARTAVVLSAISLILVIYFVYPRDHYPIIRAIDLRPWSWPSGDSLFIKDANDGTSDLLLMSIGVESGLFEVNGLRSIPTRMLKNVPPLLRYIAEQNKVVQVPLESWDTCTGKMSHSLTQSARLRGKVLATAGPTVLDVQPDPTETYVAFLSAEGKLRKSWIPFGDPAVRGDRYHQLFRISDGSEVGKPVKLKVATNRDYVSPLWSADGRYVIYTELNERLWIIDVSAVLAAATPE